MHRQQVANVTKSSDEILLQQLKWPIEYLYIGMKVKDYHASSTAATKSQHLDKWHTFHSVTDQTYLSTGQNVLKESLLVVDPTTTLGIAVDTGVLTGTATLAQTLALGDKVRIGGATYTVVVGAAAAAAVTDVTVAPSPAVAVAATAALAADSAKVVLQGLEYQTQRCAKTFNDLTIKAHGVPIYNDFPAGFFNSYTSYHYGGPNINTPEDCGLAFLPFCLYPGTYQPSGHINVSRAREFYLSWSSSVISGNNEGTLVVVGSAINFLLISDGSAVLNAVFEFIHLQPGTVVIKVTASRQYNRQNH